MSGLCYRKTAGKWTVSPAHVAYVPRRLFISTHQSERIRPIGNWVFTYLPGAHTLTPGCFKQKGFYYGGRKPEELVMNETT